MPSRRECEEYYHNCALTNAVTKKIGWYQLASEMGLPVKRSETGFGKAYESQMVELLQNMGFCVRRMPQNFPYDLLIDDRVKVDVKASRLYKGPNGNFYSYNLEKPFATCDFYILLSVDYDGHVSRNMVVPSVRVISQTQISVGENESVYHKFTDRFDLIKTASLFWEGLI